MTRDEYLKLPRGKAGKFPRLYTPEQVRANKVERKRKWREENREEYRRMAREAQRRRRRRLAESLARPAAWKIACSLCLSFGHKRSWCPLLPHERDAR